MASACFSRREHARLWCVAHGPKAFRDLGKSQTDVSFDVLAEHPFGSDFIDDAGDIRPQVSRILGSASIAAEAEWLAGVAGSDDMNAAAPRLAVERFKIVPDRRLCQGRVFHPRHESCCRMSFPLDESHSPISRLCDVQAKIKPAISGTEGEPANWLRLGT